VRRRRIPWVSLGLWSVAILGAVEGTGVALGWWQLTQTGQVLAASGASVFAVLLWLALGAVATAEGRHAAARQSAVRAKVRAGIYEALARGEVVPPEEIPEVIRRRYGTPGEVDGPADLAGPPYATRERRAYPGTAIPGGRRATDPPLPRRRRGGAPDA
jgi:hypothetical protein